MLGKSEQQRVRALLTEAVTMLCKNGLSFKAGFSVEGLLGITMLDDDQVFLVNIKQMFKAEDNTFTTFADEDTASSANTIGMVSPVMQRPGTNTSHAISVSSDDNQQIDSKGYAITGGPAQFPPKSERGVITYPAGNIDRIKPQHVADIKRENTEITSPPAGHPGRDVAGRPPGGLPSEWEAACIGMPPMSEPSVANIPQVNSKLNVEILTRLFLLHYYKYFKVNKSDSIKNT